MGIYKDVKPKPRYAVYRHIMHEYTCMWYVGEYRMWVIGHAENIGTELGFMVIRNASEQPHHIQETMKDERWAVYNDDHNRWEHDSAVHIEYVPDFRKKPRKKPRFANEEEAAIKVQAVLRG